MARIGAGGCCPGQWRHRSVFQAAEASLEPLIEIVQACIDSGLFRPQEPRFIAQVLTAAAHGAVSLELSHYFWSHAEAEQRYSTLTAAAARAFTR